MVEAILYNILNLAGLYGTALLVLVRKFIESL